MKRYALPLLGIFVAVSFLAYRIARVYLPRSFPEQGIVKAVIDGDTVELTDKSIVRYIGLDTPEIRFKQGNEWIEDPEPLALKAQQANTDLVLDKTVRLEYDQEKSDKHKRLLCYVFVDDVFINEEILKQGLGFLMIIPPNSRYADRFKQAVRYAKNGGKGVWNRESAVHTPAEKAAECIGKLAVVEGVVLRASKRQNVAFLNFGNNEQEDFTGVIFKSSYNDVERYTGRLPLLKGKEVRITGIIKEYNGPEIIINSPEQIEIIKN